VSGDQIRLVEGLKERLKTVRSKADRLQANRDRVTGELSSKIQELTRLSDRQEVLTKVLELYRVLMDKMVLNQVNAIESVVSEGLKAIFHDQELSFKLELAHKYNKISAEPYVCQGEIKGHPLDSFGGGPASIVSLILRVLVLLRLKRYKVLFLDETLAAVSDDYIEATGMFLRRLAESSKLPILLVTHKQAFLEHAVVGYQGDTEYEVAPAESGADPKPFFVVHKLRGVG